MTAAGLEANLRAPRSVDRPRRTTAETESSEKEIKIVYSAGFGRNGGTLLDRILGEVDGFFSLGEFRMVWQKGLVNNELCNCAQPFRDCPFWNRVFDRAFGGMSAIDAEAILGLAERVDKTRYLPLLLAPWQPRWFRNRVEEYREILAKLYRAIHEESGGSVLVDSSRFAGTALVLDSLPEVRLYVLHLVRDSRASCYSWQRKKRKLEVVGETQYLRRYSVLACSFWWSLRNLAAEALRRGRRYLLLRYEDFVEAPAEALSEILALAEEENRDVPLQEPRRVVFGVSHTQSGNPNRFERGPVEIRMDDEWCSKMSTIKRVVVTLLTLPLLVRYGYEPAVGKGRDEHR